MSFRKFQIVLGLRLTSCLLFLIAIASLTSALAMDQKHAAQVRYFEKCPDYLQVIERSQNLVRQGLLDQALGILYQQDLHGISEIQARELRAQSRRIYELAGKTIAHSIVSPARFAKNALVALAVSPDGYTLVTFNVFDEFQLWSTESLSPIALADGLMFPRQNVLAVTFVDDKHVLAVLRNRRELRTINIDSAEVVPTESRFKNLPVFLNEARFSQNGKFLAATSQHELLVVELVTGEISVVSEEQASINALAVSNDGKLLAACKQSTNEIKIWNRDGKVVAIGNFGPYPVGAIAFLTDNKTLIYHQHDKGIRVCDIGNLPTEQPPSWEEINQTFPYRRRQKLLVTSLVYKSNLEDVFFLNFNSISRNCLKNCSSDHSREMSKDSSNLESSSTDSTLYFPVNKKLWNVHSGTVGKKSFRIEGTDILAVSPDWRFFFLKYKDPDRLSLVYDVKEEKVFGDLWRNEKVFAAAFSPNGMRLAVGFEKKLVVYTLNGRNLREEYSWEPKEFNELGALAFVNDETFLSFQFGGGDIREWKEGNQTSSPSREVFHDSVENADLILHKGVSVSPDQKYWAGVTRNGQLIIGDIAEKRQLSTPSLQNLSNVGVVSFLKSGELFVVSTFPRPQAYVYDLAKKQFKGNRVSLKTESHRAFVSPDGKMVLLENRIPHFIEILE